MMNIKNFESKVLDANALDKLIGGWVGVVQTPTGTIRHYIDECDDGDLNEHWEFTNLEGQNFIAFTPQPWASEGDFG